MYLVESQYKHIPTEQECGANVWVKVTNLLYTQNWPCCSLDDYLYGSSL